MKTRGIGALFVLVMFLVIASLTPGLAEGPTNFMPERFVDAKAIDAWIGNGQSGIIYNKAFSHGEKCVVVLVSGYGSGIPRSRIHIYDRQGDGSYNLMLERRTFLGIVFVREENNALVFRSQTDILILPWDGVISGMEQVSPSRPTIVARPAVSCGR